MVKDGSPSCRSRSRHSGPRCTASCPRRWIGDGELDLLLAGNLDGATPAIGRMRASYGLLLRGNGAGGFTPIPAVASGFFVPAQARDIQPVRGQRGLRYVVTRNDDRALLFEPARPTSGR